MGENDTNVGKQCCWTSAEKSNELVITSTHLSAHTHVYRTQKIENDKKNYVIHVTGSVFHSHDLLTQSKTEQRFDETTKIQMQYYMVMVYD